MTPPFYADDWLTVYGGDCREVMAGMEPESVHCVVTSPPYWGLRDYGTATWIGGDEACDHRKVQDAVAAVATSTLGGGKLTTGHQREGFGSVCRRCGATRQDRQLGLEPTPEEYVANLVDVFRKVRRVLRADGTVWLNLGDSYNSGPAGNTKPSSTGAVNYYRGAGIDGKTQRLVASLKPKDLVGIPWRVAFALQADGWYLRSDIIWAKPNPMPESVTDRPTKAHEYLFLLSKSARYYFDAEAVREESTYDGPNAPDKIASPFGQGFTRRAKVRGHVRPHEGFDARWDGLTKAEQGANGRNIRSVWTVATTPYPGAHYAVFPEKLVEPCILAGCPVNGVTLDPFAGSGTVGRVANRLSRRAVLIDLNPDYLTQQMARNRDIPLGLGA